MSGFVRFSDFGTAWVYAKGVFLHHIGVPAPMGREQAFWCVERFGPDAITRDNWSLDYTTRGTTYYYLNQENKWTYSYTTFIFEEPEMAFEFKMRWG